MNKIVCSQIIKVKCCQTFFWLTGVYLFLILKGVSWGGLEEFRFINLQIEVLTISNQPVQECFVKIYSNDWPISYPHDGFAKTNVNGIIIFHVPRGNYTIVAGGGFPYSNFHSGKGLFLTIDTNVEHNMAITLKPEVNHTLLLKFFDRIDSLVNLDSIYAAPSKMVPNCLMPEIGNTNNGSCSIYTNSSSYMTFFLIRKPTLSKEGYFVLENIMPLGTSEIHTRRIALNHIHFDGSI